MTGLLLTLAAALADPGGLLDVPPQQVCPSPTAVDGRLLDLRVTVTLPDDLTLVGSTWRPEHASAGRVPRWPGMLRGRLHGPPMPDEDGELSSTVRGWIDVFGAAAEECVATEGACDDPVEHTVVLDAGVPAAVMLRALPPEVDGPHTLRLELLPSDVANPFRAEALASVVVDTTWVARNDGCWRVRPARTPGVTDRRGRHLPAPG